MNIFVATRNCLKRSFDYTSRSRRSEFWGFLLGAALVCFFLGLFDKLLFGASWPLKETLIVFENGVSHKRYSIETGYGPISSGASFLFLIPIVSAAVRRLHDTGRRGLFLLLPLSVLIIATVLLNIKSSAVFAAVAIFWMLMIFIAILLFKDSGHDNRYGVSEKYPGEAPINPMFDK